MTTVSVVIPAYNAQAWISETLESVLTQDFDDFEVIVVDDGSTDDTAAVVANFGRVQYIHKPNGGAASARNVGIRAARGEYVAFVDADDLWLPDKLRLQVDLLKRTGLMWVYSDAYAFDGRTGRTLYTFSKLSRLYTDDVLRPLFLNDFIPSPTPVVGRSVFEQVGYFDESEILRKREDWDMWLRIAARYPVGLVNRPLARYQVHSASSTGGEHPLVALESQLAVIERAVAREPERLAHLKNQAIAQVCIGTGRTLARDGNLAEARMLFARAIRLVPGAAEAYLYWLSCLTGKPLLNVAIRLRHWLRYKQNLSSRV